MDSKHASCKLLMKLVRVVDWWFVVLADVRGGTACVSGFRTATTYAANFAIDALQLLHVLDVMLPCAGVAFNATRRALAGSDAFVPCIWSSEPGP